EQGKAHSQSCKYPNDDDSLSFHAFHHAAPAPGMEISKTHRFEPLKALSLRTTVTDLPSMVSYICFCHSMEQLQ
ncbi:MAG: hypothetical protein WAO20_10540, partial [Acidobacteriota bacterium]